MSSNELILAEDEDSLKVLEDVSPSGRRRPWGEFKAASGKLASFYEVANQVVPVLSEKRLDDLKSCGEMLEFDVLADGRKELRRAWFCRVRLCPMCMWRRSLKLAGRMKRAVDGLKLANPSVRFIFVTLTQRNCGGGDLGEVLTCMTSSFSKLMKARRLSQLVLGYMRSIEVTVNDRSWTCHPHVHAILAVRADYFSGRNYVKQADWREMWRLVMGLDYLPQVNVKALRADDWSVVECAKYSVKAVDSLADAPDRGSAVQMLVDLTVGMKNRRLISFGGVFRGLQFEDDDSGCVEDCDGSQAVGRLVYRWSPMVGVYVEV